MHGQLGGGGNLTKSLTICFFLCFQLSAQFTEGVKLQLEKGLVKCVETLQGFCLIDSSQELVKNTSRIFQDRILMTNIFSITRSICYEK